MRELYEWNQNEGKQMCDSFHSVEEVELQLFF